MNWTGGARGGKRARTVAVRNRAARTSAATARAVRAAYTPRASARRYPVKGAIAPYAGRQELKYLDVPAGTMACDTTGAVACLNLLAVGDDNTTRDGRQVTIKSVQIKGIIRPQDTGTLNTMARVLLVWDNANNSAAAVPTITQILSASGSQSFPLIDNANRFTILMDQSFPVAYFNNTATQAVAGAPTVHLVEKYLKINQVTQYSGTTNTIGSIQNGSLLLVTIGDQATGDGANLIVATRVRFTDS